MITVLVPHDRATPGWRRRRPPGQPPPVELPDGDGVEIATHLRAHAPSLPIAFFTSVPSAELADRARAIGPVFEKPADLDDAIRWLRELVERK